MIDIFMDASSHYGQAVDSSTYFELALLKICNQIENEHKEVVVEEPKVIKNVSHETLVEVQQEEVIEKPVEKIQEPVIEPQEDLQEKVEEKKEPKVEQVETPVEEAKEEVKEVKTTAQIEVEFNDILNILVQAKRTVLNDIQDKWPVIRRYCYNLNTAKYANMLCDAKPVAAGEKGFILTLKYQPEVNSINYTENYYPLKNFLKEVLGSEYDFIAVMEADWPNMRQKFIQLSKEKKLPQPQPIVLHHIDEYHEPVVELTEAQQYAIDMFGDEIVEFEE